MQPRIISSLFHLSLTAIIILNSTIYVCNQVPLSQWMLLCTIYMSETCLIATDWTLPTTLVSPAQRRIECLPAEPLSERQLVGFLQADAVVEVWLPLYQQHSGESSSGTSERLIRDVWIEFADRYHALRYEHPGGGCPVAWYRALRPIETDSIHAMVDDLTAQYTRLSRRPAATGA